MTVKQEFYSLYEKGVPDEAQIREFVSNHYSVQWRRRGKSAIQVKFNERESWVDVESFADNYYNKVAKQLNDLMLSSSKIITHGDLWRMTSDGFKAAVEKYFYEQFTSDGTLDAEEVSELQAKNDSLLDKVSNLEAKLEKSEDALIRYQQVTNTLRDRLDEVALIIRAVRDDDFPVSKGTVELIGKKLGIK